MDMFEEMKEVMFFTSQVADKVKSHVDRFVKATNCPNEAREDLLITGTVLEMIRLLNSNDEDEKEDASDEESKTKEVINMIKAAMEDEDTEVKVVKVESSEAAEALRKALGL